MRKSEDGSRKIRYLDTKNKKLQEMKDFAKIFVGAIAVVLGLSAGNWLGDKASKGIDWVVDKACKKDAPAAADAE